MSPEISKIRIDDITASIMILKGEIKKLERSYLCTAEKIAELNRDLECEEKGLNEDRNRIKGHLETIRTLEAATGKKTSNVEDYMGTLDIGLPDRQSTETRGRPYIGRPMSPLDAIC